MLLKEGSDRPALNFKTPKTSGKLSACPTTIEERIAPGLHDLFKHLVMSLVAVVLQLLMCLISSFTLSIAVV